MIKETEIAHDKKILEQADKIWGREGKAGRLRLERRARMIAKVCDLGPGKRVLEIGCGTGTLTEILVTTGAAVTAIDILPEFLEITRKKCGQHSIETRIADAETLEGIPDGSFDAVVGLSVLHHLNIDSVLTNIHRVLREGGICAFSEPNMLNPQIALQKNIPFLKKMLGDTPDETAFFSWKIKKVLRKHGYQAISVYPFDFLHPVVPDSLSGLVDKTGLFMESIPLVRQIAGSLFIVAKKGDSINQGRSGPADAEEYFNAIAREYDYWKDKNHYYNHSLACLYKSLIPVNSSVTEIGCGTGNIIAYLEPREGLGLDISDEMIHIARKKHAERKNIRFRRENILDSKEIFRSEYVILADVLEHVDKLQDFLRRLALRVESESTVIISLANPIWEPFLMLIEKLGLKMPEGPHKRYSVKKTEKMYEEAGLVVMERGYRLLIPKKVPGAEWINKRFYKSRLLERLGFTVYWVLKKRS